MSDIRRHWYGYSFRAWTDEHGSNVDRLHEVGAVTTHRLPHYRLWDFNTNRKCRNILRIIRRRKPFFLQVVVGAKYRTLLRIGR